MRTVVWYSCGAASSVAAKLTLEQYPDSLIVCCVIPSEHPDNERFMKDCEKWYGKEIIKLKSEKFIDSWDVFERTKYLVGPSGARCTTELKKKVRQKFQKISDRQVFGFTLEEKDRADRFKNQNPEVNLITPLIDQAYSKQKCKDTIEAAGIELPAMYKLGYKNNNCIGCVKGGAKYWANIKRDFPDVYDRMAKLERSLGRKILKVKGCRVFLDELNHEEANMEPEFDFQCGVLCGPNETIS